MDVNSVGAAAAPGAGPSTASASAQSAQNAALDYDSFLKLLIAQMQNQDPLNPMDSTEYVSQLAAFSSVEQAIQTNTKLDSLLGSLTLSQAGSIVGRTVTSSDGKITGEVVSVRIFSDGLLATLDSGESLVIGPGITIE